MRKFTEVFLLVIATILMFAFPALLLGMAPWLGEGMLHLMHFQFSHGLWSAVVAIVTLLGSSAGLMVLAIPAFGGVLWALGKAIRAQAEPLPAPTANTGRLTARDEAPAAKVRIPHPSRPMGTLRDLAEGTPTEAPSGPSLPKLRSKRISTVRRNGEEITPRRDR